MNINHTLSPNGLKLTSSAYDEQGNQLGRIVIDWENIQVANQNIESTRASNEKRLRDVINNAQEREDSHSWVRVLAFGKGRAVVGVHRSNVWDEASVVFGKHKITVGSKNGRLNFRDVHLSREENRRFIMGVGTLRHGASVALYSA